MLAYWAFPLLIPSHYPISMKNPSSPTISHLIQALLLLFFFLFSIYNCLRNLNLSTKMTIKTGANHACAACKYQRRRCSKDCVLAPYFPADKAKLFQYAHRLFGVHNIMKILKQVHVEQQEEAMRSIIYESYIRAIYPVHGCYGAICLLNFQLQQSIEELRYVHTRLAICKEQCQYQIPPSPVSSSSQLDSGTSSNSNLTMPLMTPSNFFVEADDDLANKISRVHLTNGNNIMNDVIQSYYLDFPPQQEIVPHDYEGTPFDSIMDDRQPYNESKEAGFDSTRYRR